MVRSASSWNLEMDVDPALVTSPDRLVPTAAGAATSQALSLTWLLLPTVSSVNGACSREHGGTSYCIGLAARRASPGSAWCSAQRQQGSSIGASGQHRRAKSS